MEELLDQFARSGDGSLRQTLLDELGTALDVHLTFEESEIHPMVVVIDERDAAVATCEHALLRTAFERLRQHDGVDAGDFAAAVDRLAAGLSRHAADEEFDALPASASRGRRHRARRARRAPPRRPPHRVPPSRSWRRTNRRYDGPVPVSSPIRLRYGSDQEAGIRRRGTRRFHYVNERTGKDASAADRRRIAALAIPPAWTDVWIAASPDSHVQATGQRREGPQAVPLPPAAHRRAVGAQVRRPRHLRRTPRAAASARPARPRHAAASGTTAWSRSSCGCST